MLGVLLGLPLGYTVSLLLFFNFLTSRTFLASLLDTLGHVRIFKVILGTCDAHSAFHSKRTFKQVLADAVETFAKTAVCMVTANIALFNGPAQGAAKQASSHWYSS